MNTFLIHVAASFLGTMAAVAYTLGLIAFIGWARERRGD